MYVKRNIKANHEYVKKKVLLEPVKNLATKFQVFPGDKELEEKFYHN